MRVVVDASVAVKWILPDPEIEPDSDRALQLLAGIQQGKVHPVQPPHWLAEVGAVITRLRPAIAREAVDLLIALELPVEDALETYRRAVRMAEELKHHLFDTLYHAVALERDAVLVSADAHYMRKAGRFGHLLALSAWQASD